MTHRSDRVYLADDVARCAPSQPCAAKERCARYMAAIPQRGASFGDFSISLVSGVCPCYMPIKHKPKDEPRKEVKPWPTA